MTITPNNNYSEENVYELVKNKGLKVGDEIIVAGILGEFSNEMPQITEEIVTEVFKNHFIDTRITKLNGEVLNEDNYRMRYFAEGWRGGIGNRITPKSVEAHIADSIFRFHFIGGSIR